MARNAVDDIEGLCFPSALPCMIATRSSVPPCELCFSSGEFTPFCYRPQSELSAFAKRWVRSVKNECLSKLILFGETSLRRTITEFLKHHHQERNHQGKGNMLLFPDPRSPPSRPHSVLTCHERLGGLLKFYQPAA